MPIAQDRSRSPILREGLWVAGGQLAVAVGLIVTMRLVTQYTTREVVGTVSLMMAIGNFARGLFAVPISLAAVRFYPDMQRDGRLPDLRRAVMRILLITTAALGLAIILGGLTLGRYWYLGPTLILLTVALFALEVFRTQETDLLSAGRLQKAASLFRGGEALLKPLLIVPAVLLIAPTPEMILAGHIAATGIVLAIIWSIQGSGFRVQDRPISPPLNPEPRTLTTSLWYYARPLVPITIFTYIMSISDRLIIEPIAGRGELGLYAAIYGLASLPILMLGVVLETTIRPAYYQAVSEKRPDSGRIFLRWLAVTAGLGALACLAIHLLRQPIVTLLLGPDFRRNPELLAPIAAGHVLYILAVVFERFCHARGRTRPSQLIYGIAAAICLIAQIPLIRRYGIAGAAFAVPIYYGAMLLTAMGAAAWLRAQAIAGPTGAPSPRSDPRFRDSRPPSSEG